MIINTAVAYWLSTKSWSILSSRLYYEFLDIQYDLKFDSKNAIFVPLLKSIGTEDKLSAVGIIPNIIYMFLLFIYIFLLFIIMIFFIYLLLHHENQIGGGMA